MRPLTVTISVLVALGFTPITASADCNNYQLTPAQQAFLDQQDLAIQIPEGTVPLVQLCDTNGDTVVDRTDIRNIGLARNQPSSDPDDPRDWDRNGVINILDARGCQRACAAPRCAPVPPQPDPQGGELVEVECSQAQDFDGDGSQDFIGMYENTEDDRSSGYKLELVILNEDENGNIQQTTFPYAGQVSVVEGETIINQHVSVQPPGEVNLAPGNITIDQPAVVSYSFGQPEVIYYWEDGRLKRAFYGIDD